MPGTARPVRSVTWIKRVASAASIGLARSTVNGSRVRMQYTKAFSDDTEVRSVTPRRVFFDRGNWYVLADDHDRGEERHFRIDRIAGLELTGVHDAPRSVEAPSGDEWFADAGLPTVTLDQLAAMMMSTPGHASPA